MKEVTINIPENLYQLSDEELAVIHALCFYAPEGMTKKADAVRYSMMQKLNLHHAVGKFKVWD